MLTFVVDLIGFSETFSYSMVVLILVIVLVKFVGRHIENYKGSLPILL